MFHNKYKWTWILIFILITTSVIRLWNLSENPKGFFADEASHGIEAYSILKTGADTYGVPYPVLFKALLDYKDPVMIYSMVPFLYVFGPSVFAVRLVSAIYGIAAICMMYLLVRQLSDPGMALVAAFLLAISPWHVHFSRVGFQLIATIFWLLFAFYFLLKSLKNAKYYPLSALGFVLTFFTYSTVKMYLGPLYILSLISLWPHSKKLLTSTLFWFTNLVSAGITVGLIYPYLQDGTFFSRWNQVQVSAPQGLEIVKSYLNHFSFDFLFLKGDAEFPGQQVKRHSLIGMGELHLFQLPFLLIGLCTLLFSKAYTKFHFFFWFLLLYPLGTIFTAEEPQATRSVLGIIPFTILTALGIHQVYTILKNNNAKISYLVGLGGIFIISLYILIIHLSAYPLHGAGYWGWQSGLKESIELFQKHENAYDAMLITHRFNMGHVVLEFFNYHYNCKKCSIMSNPIEIDQTKKQLFALRMEDIEEARTLYPELHFKTVDRYMLPNGKTELYIGAFEKKD